MLNFNLHLFILTIILFSNSFWLLIFSFILSIINFISLTSILDNRSILLILLTFLLIPISWNLRKKRIITYSLNKDVIFFPFILLFFLYDLKMKLAGKDLTEYLQFDILPPLSSGKYIVSSGGKNGAINSLLSQETWANKPSTLEITIARYETLWFVKDFKNYFVKVSNENSEVYNPCFGLITGIFKLDNYMRVQFLCNNNIIELFPIKAESINVKEGSLINFKTKIGDLYISEEFKNGHLHLNGFTANSMGYVNNSPVALTYKNKFLTTGLVVEFL